MQMVVADVLDMASASTAPASMSAPAASSAASGPAAGSPGPGAPPCSPASSSPSSSSSAASTRAPPLLLEQPLDQRAAADLVPGLVTPEAAVPCAPLPGGTDSSGIVAVVYADVEEAGLLLRRPAAGARVG